MSSPCQFKKICTTILPGSNHPRSTDSDLIHGTIIAKRQVHITSGALCLSQKPQLRGYCDDSTGDRDQHYGLPQVCQRALCQVQLEAPDVKILSMDLDEQLVNNFVKDGIITVESSNMYCEEIRLKIHSNIADASLVLTQIKFKITRDKFISDEACSISVKLQVSISPSVQFTIISSGYPFFARA